MTEDQSVKQKKPFVPMVTSLGTQLGTKMRQVVHLKGMYTMERVVEIYGLINQTDEGPRLAALTFKELFVMPLTSQFKENAVANSMKLLEQCVEASCQEFRNLVCEAEFLQNLKKVAELQQKELQQKARGLIKMFAENSANDSTFQVYKALDEELQRKSEEEALAAKARADKNTAEETDKTQALSTIHETSDSGAKHEMEETETKNEHPPEAQQADSIPDTADVDD